MHRKILVACLFLAGAATMNLAHSDHSSVVFTIETQEVDDAQQRMSIVSGVELESITPIRRGNSSDIDCEGLSDSDGVLTCMVRHCDATAELANTYRLAFKPPRRFDSVRDVEVRVKRCEVTPSPIVAMLVEPTLVAQALQRDIEAIFGQPIGAAPGQLLGDVTPEAYGEQVVVIMGESLGLLRARSLRRFVQDASLNALRDGQGLTAYRYQRLAVAHATALLWYAGENLGADSDLFQVTDSYQEIETSTIIAEQLIAWIDEQDYDSSDSFVQPYSETLSELRASAENGELANREFFQLEKLVADLELLPSSEVGHFAVFPN